MTPINAIKFQDYALPTMSAKGMCVFHATRHVRQFDETPDNMVYRLVAVVTAKDDNPETAYRLTNSIEDAWYEDDGHPDVYPFFAEHHEGEGCRSTSIHDLVRLSDGSWMKCAPVGWKPCKAPSFIRVPKRRVLSFPA